MSTAVDTSVFVALFSGDERTSKVEQAALEDGYDAETPQISLNSVRCSRKGRL